MNTFCATMVLSRNAFLVCKTNNTTYKNFTNQVENNYAFLDMQNLIKGVKARGWSIDWVAFRNYLRDQHNVVKAVVFIGYIKENKPLYDYLRRVGFVLEFRPVKQLRDGTIDGGNVDADLASYVMDYKNEYMKAVIIADDGDYYKTVLSLQRQNKLKLIISSHLIENTSWLLRKAAAPNQIVSIHSLIDKIGRFQQRA